MSNIYKSHEKVKVWPKTRGEYNTYQGWDIPEDENPEDVGYLVEYLDGGKPNHPDHEGHITWTPKEQFDNGYTLVPETFVGRLELEYKGLINDQHALCIFMGTDTYRNLSLAQKTCMQKQVNIMQEFLDILCVRLQLNEHDITGEK